MRTEGCLLNIIFIFGLATAFGQTKSSPSVLAPAVTAHGKVKEE